MGKQQKRTAVIAGKTRKVFYMEKAPKGYGYVYYGRGVHLKSNEWIKEQKGKSNKKAK